MMLERIKTYADIAKEVDKIADLPQTESAFKSSLVYKITSNNRTKGYYIFTPCAQYTGCYYMDIFIYPKYRRHIFIL